MKGFPRPKEYAPCPWCGKQPEECSQHAPTGHDGKTRALDVDVACRSARCIVRPQGPSVREPITGTETIGEDLKIAPGAWEAALLRARKKLVKAWNHRATHAMTAWYRRRIEEQRAASKPQRCWYCGKAGPDRRIMSGRIKPGGRRCKTRMVGIHETCRQEMLKWQD